MTTSLINDVITIDEYRVEITQSMDNILLIPIVQNMAKTISFSDVDRAMLATIASELATNILRYAKQGEMIVRVIRKSNEINEYALEIIAVDKGPGIKNIDLAVKDNFTTLENSMGMGLPFVKRFMDEFFIDSKINEGTAIIVRKWCSYVQD